MKSLSRFLSRWYAQQNRASKRRASRMARRRNRANLRGFLEPLEDRRLLAAITVAWATTPEGRADALRAAVATANGMLGRDQITFATEYSSIVNGPNEILLKRSGVGSASADIEIHEAVDIIGPGADKVLISGNRDGSNDANEATRLFWIEYDDAPETDKGVSLIKDLTLANGYATVNADQVSGRLEGRGIGGAIAALESLHLNGVVLKNNFAAITGGAVGGTMLSMNHLLKIENSIFEENAALGGGGIYYYGGLPGG